MRLWTTLAAIAGFTIFAANAHADDAKKALAESEFVHKASTANRTEIAASKIAQKRAQNDGVKKFANRMIKDHTKAKGDLLAIVADQRFTVPNKLDPNQEKQLEQLKIASANDFDKVFMMHMLEDHEMAVDLFSRASKQLKDEKLKAYAEKTLPILKEHLALARKVNDELR